MKYTFHTEDGPQTLEYDDYLLMPELMKNTVDPMRKNLYLGSQILSYDRDWLNHHPSTKDMFEQLKKEQEENPLKFFMPNCASCSTFDSPSHQFINDLDPESRFKGLIAPNRLGKALWDEEVVQTPDGPIRIADMRPNMPVFGSDGKTYTCIGAFPQGVRKTYKMHFGDQVLIADGEHLWKACEGYRHRAGYLINPKWKIVTTKQMFEGGKNWHIPRAKPIDYEGSLDQPWSIGDHHGATHTPFTTEQICVKEQHRIHMIRGLFDQCARSTSRPYIDSKNIEFLKSVTTLLGTFGISTKTWHKNKTTTRLLIGKMSFNPFTKPVKGTQFITGENFANVRYISKIEEWEDLPCTCISVDSPDSLFLCNDFLVTHNTTIAYIALLSTCGLIPNDPEWPIYKAHGVKYVPYTEPKEVAIVSYGWDNFSETIIPQIIQAWTPKEELGRYATISPNPKGNRKFMKLKCGSVIHFKAMSQTQKSFEGVALDEVLLDEQSEEHKFDGLEARMLTKYKRATVDGEEIISSGRFLGAFTPHVLPERPQDTGANGWMYHMAHGTNTKGLEPHFYNAYLNDVPHWIFSEEMKQKKYEQAEIAAEKYANGTGTLATLNGIRSRVYGEWEVTGGKVFPEFNKHVHVIDDFPIPNNWTVRRGFDHGRTNPSAMVCVATAPNGDNFAFLSHCHAGEPIHPTVDAFVKVCGNTLKRLPDERFGYASYAKFEEICDNFRSANDYGDGRSLGRKAEDAPIMTRDMYRFAGLNRIQCASRVMPEKRIEAIRELMILDHTRKHPFTEEMGAPRIYFFREGAAALIDHLMNYKTKTVAKDGKISEKPVDKDDHDIDAIGYIVIEGMRWMAGKPCRGGGGTSGYWMGDDYKNSRKSGDRFTGYR